MSESVSCRVLRCAKQDEMYLYLRADLDEDAIPEALRARLGTLSEVMQLQLHSQRKLARVDVEEVIRRLQSDGLYLQMPPSGLVQARLYQGD